ncbi:carboxylate-amine ligase [Actinomadura livida]|uniref:Putative glutamate--cysteine ligase 2 n=1 Tax=Actinomadura livida TaxID=79909 RepID=A0A7W7IDE9_9ACTN|nr:MULTISPECIES: glutamate--cysteine ligase [Actinomadura]MBB4775062.1 carboxylate-amine ligase [Actinomadura catellatispora]GGT87536.1 putative glutamate--cysteine ligase 2-3 [Actinomadura livida]
MPLRLGIEEEYFVVDPVSREVVPRAAAVVRRAAAALGERASTELVDFLAEAKTPPCDDLGKLDEQIRSMRSAMAAAAAAEGVRLAATGTPVLGEVIPAPIAAGPRYAESRAVYRGLDDEQSICSCHVHVEMPDRERAVQVSNHLRPWLPTLLALTANSPYWSGRDTGHACWRVMAWARWPVAGPPPYFESAAHYDDLVGTLLGCGALMDTGTIFWDVRPSARLPTVEIRLADVAPTAGDAAAFAALIRALVQVSAAAVDAGERAPDPSQEMLRAAYWLAARDGLAGTGMDVRTGRPARHRELAGDLLAHVLPALRDSGDLGTVAGGVRRLLTGGTGAERQRGAYRRRGRLTDVVDAAILRDR